MLTLTLRASTAVPLEVEGIIPEALRDKTAAEIERLPIFHGNRQVPLAEWFAVAGDAGDEQLTFAGDCGGVHWIGAKIRRGVVRVEGNAGRHVGSEARGGEVHVFGDASDWVGGELHGGLIHVRGNAGDLVGSAYRGSPRGMTGGSLLVDGRVGNELAHSMRRGLIAVGGDAGDFPCLNMIAGSVLVFGTVGDRPAAGMRRGTLAVFGRPPRLLNTFKPTGLGRPPFFPLYFAALRRQGFTVPADVDAAEYRLYTGDLLTVGKGEVLVKNAWA